MNRSVIMAADLDVWGAVEVVLAQAAPLPARTVSSTAALGAILSKDVVATRPHPPFAASIKDGYAVRSADGARDFLVVGASRAGHSDQSVLAAGEAVYITTGAPLPAGADCVVQVEQVLHLAAHEPLQPSSVADHRQGKHVNAVRLLQNSGDANR